MVQKTYWSRASHKPFYVQVSALTLAFLLAFSPLQIFAQEKVPVKGSGSPVSQDTSIPDSRINSGNTTPIDPTDTSKPNPEVLGAEDTDTGPDGRIEDPIKPTDTTKPEPVEYHQDQDDEENNSDEEDVPEGSRDNEGIVRTTSITSESLKRDLKVAGNDGSLSYNYELAIPPGRNGLDPALSLVYSNNDRKNDSFLGYGWSLDIPYIERLNKTGSEKIYTADYFSSSMTGELVSTGSGGIYVSKIDNGEFISYTYDSGYWIVYDKSGTKYTFGLDAEARQDDPNDSGRVYKWMIQEIRDTNDNYIKFEYFKDNGQIYPETITYTGNGSTDGIFTVNFELDEYEVSPDMYYADFAIKTDYRIERIEIQEDTEWVRRYDLAYSLGDAGYRSLLESVTESGRDIDTNETVTKDPTIFTYKERGPVTWVEDTDWNLPTTLTYGPGNANYSKFLQIKDANGDAYPDILFSAYPNSWSTLLSNGDGTWDSFDDNDPYEYWKPAGMFMAQYGLKDAGTRMFDYNGDMLTDFVNSFGWDGAYNSDPADTGYKKIGTGLSTDTWVDGDNEFAVPLTFSYEEDWNATNATDIVDVNADGLADLVWGVENYWDTPTRKTFVGDGVNWNEVDSGQWLLPYGTMDADSQYFTNVQFPDVNGDGLSDFIYGNEHDGPTNAVNNGHEWDTDVPWNIDIDTQKYPVVNSTDLGVRFFDVNGDGLTDQVYSRMSDLEVISSNVYLNQPDVDGPNFAGVGGVDTLPLAFANDGNGESRHSIIVDINADGMDDLLEAYIYDSNPVIHTYISQGTPFTDMLISIENPEGGTSEIDYKLSTQYFNDEDELLNPHLPIGVTTVSQITTDDAFGNTAETNYTYADGSYYYNGPTDRKFAGFGLVTETDDLGNVTKTYYQQANTTNDTLGEYDDNSSKMGKAYRIEKYDDSENLYELTINKYKNSPITTGADFVYQMSSTNLSYDGDGDHKDTAIEYAYDDANGNLVSKASLGEVTADTDGSFTDTGSDLKTEQYTYAVDPYYRIRSKVSEYQTLDQSSSVVNKKITYYDNQSQGTVVIGNPTQEDQLISGSDYSTTTYAYDGIYGLVKDAYDPLNNHTSYTYDTHNLYPATIKNALNQETDYTYDYSSGKPINITDPNGHQNEYVYDGFDRILEEKESAPDNASTLVLKNEYAYDDTSGQISVEKTMHLDGSLSHDEYQYFDGLGRLIQTRSEAEGTSTYNVKDTEYDALGRVSMESLPYSDSGSAISSPTTDADLQITHEYDPLGRIHQMSNIIGDTRYEYDQWKTTITNQNDVPKDLHKDAFNRLIQVDEHNATSTYSTLYEWDLNDKLVGMEDALGNVRSFGYDNLGHRLTATDLHATGDGTYGTWYYEYDEAGNMINLVDPNGDIITYEYDELNRIASEDSDTNGTGLDVEYTYDTCVNGIGKLCTVENSQNITTDYHYFENGLLQEEARDIDGKAYSVTFSYDRQGNILTVEYVDKSITQYSYNKGNQIETVVQDEDGVPPVDIISDIDYSPHGAPAFIEYGNGVETTNTYDAAEMYRLDNILTTDGTDDWQDITFEAYDAMGNITSIKDQSDTDATKDVAYTYDDLNRLISVDATGTANSADYSRDYTYNAIGNMMTSDWGFHGYNGNTGVSYANPHAATSVSSITFAYDKNGNTLYDINTTNTWNYRNELAQALYGGVTTYTYKYDHNSDRMSVDDGSSTSYYPNKYYNEIDSEVTKNIYLKDTLVGTVEGSGSGATYHYNHTDHLTGSNVTTDDTGDLEQTLDYYPFGEVRLDDQVTSFDQNRKYAGSVADDTGLNYMNARYQDGKASRFISQDPVFLNPEGSGPDIFNTFLTDPQTQNSYSYARNNPIILNDPDGKFIPLIVGAIYAAAPAIIAGAETAAVALTAGLVAHDVGTIAGTAMSGAPSSYKNDVYSGVAENWGAGLSAASQLSPAIVGETRAGTVAESQLSKSYQVYEKVNSVTGQVYVGRTSGLKSPELNVKIRDYNHHMTDKGFGAAELKYSSSQYDAIRGQEQMSIDRYRTQGVSGNSINGISPKNSNLGRYFSAALKAFGKK